MWRLETHCVFSVPQILDINLCLLKLFENITRVRCFFLYNSVDTITAFVIQSNISGFSFLFALLYRPARRHPMLWRNKKRRKLNDRKIKNQHGKWWKCLHSEHIINLHDEHYGAEGIATARFRPNGVATRGETNLEHRRELNKYVDTPVN